MPMRNRRVRLLVLAVFITVAFFLYSSSDPTTIEGAKQYAQRTYQSALDQYGKKTSSDSTAAAAEPVKDEPFRVDFGKYSRAANAAAEETSEPARIPPPAQPVPQPPKKEEPAVEKVEPKKDDPMRVDFEHYSKAAAAGASESSSPASNEVIANPNPIVGVVGAKETSSAVAAKPTAAPAKAPQPLAAPNVPPIGKPKDQLSTDHISPIGEGRVEIDVNDPTLGDSVHWSKLVERFPPTSTIQFPFNTGSAIAKIQFDFKKAGVKADAEKLAAIKAAAVHTWEGYKNNAMGHDETRPVTGKYANPFNGWGATLVDSLDTLWLMGMIPQFEDALTWVKKIDFTTSKRSDIPVFETTIRYMGGLLGAYEISGRNYQVLLDQAKQLGEILYGAFDTPNRMPMTYYHWKPAFASQGHRAPSHTILAEIGSLSLEFTRLGQLVGETKYFDAISRITNALEEWQPRTRIPGLWPTTVDASGCKKLPSTDEDMRKFSESKGPSEPLPNRMSEPLPKYPDESANKGSGAIGGKEAGLGRIKGFGSPLEEGALDSQAAKDSLLSGGFKAAKRAFENVKAEVGAKLHDIAESEPVKHVNAALHDIAESDPVKQVQGTLHDIAGSAPVKAVTNTLTNSAAAGINKQEARSSSQIPLDDEDSCIPQGLTSTHAYSSDIFTFGAAADSTYEYLPKMHMLMGGRVDQYRRMYTTAIAAAKKNLLSRAMIPDEKREVLFVGNMDVKPDADSPTKMESVFSAGGSHLTCFVGGMFAMAGKIFDNPEDVEIGAKLTDGCVWAYNSTATGIMPELFGLYKCDSMERCKWDEEAYGKALDPHETMRLKAAKPPTRDPRVLTKPRSKSDAATRDEVDDDRGSDLRKRQFGGGEMQYGVNTAPESLSGAAAAVAAEVPPYAIGQQGAAGSKPPSDDTVALKNPFEAGAAPRLPADGVPKAGDAKGGPAFPAAPDANARPLTEKPVADSKPAGSSPGAGGIPPANPDRGVAPTVPDTKSGSLSDKKVAPGVPDTGIAATSPDTGVKLSSGSGFGRENVAPASPVKLAPGVDSVPETRPHHIPPPAADAADVDALPHDAYVKNKIKTERLPPGMVGLYSKKYLLRPEAIESVFYMWRITGDPYWRERGWEMWLAVDKATKAAHGATAIEDVTLLSSTRHDSQESFWLAETLKYFYLLFDDPDRYSLDDWVLNTEAHFLSRLGA